MTDFAMELIVSKQRLVRLHHNKEHQVFCLETFTTAEALDITTDQELQDRRESTVARYEEFIRHRLFLTDETMEAIAQLYLTKLAQDQGLDITRNVVTGFQTFTAPRDTSI